MLNSAQLTYGIVLQFNYVTRDKSIQPNHLSSTQLNLAQPFLYNTDGSQVKTGHTVILEYFNKKE